MLEHGRIVEQGSPAELLAADGPFRRLAGSPHLAQTPAHEPGQFRPASVRARPGR